MTVPPVRVFTVGMETTSATKTTKFVRDDAGKKAYVRTAVTPGSEVVDQDATYVWYVDLRTGAYYVVKAR